MLNHTAAISDSDECASIVAGGMCANMADLETVPDPVPDAPSGPSEVPPPPPVETPGPIPEAPPMTEPAPSPSTPIAG